MLGASIEATTVEDMEALAASITVLASDVDRSKASIAILADETIQYQAVVDVIENLVAVIDGARSAGFVDVLFAVEKK